MPFSAAWLDLREAADARARNAVLQERLAAWCAGREELTIADLGAGTGANLRHLAPRLTALQRWILVEHDGALIEAGKRRLAARPTAFRYLELDLARDLEHLEGECPALLTASALLDLVGTGWLQRLAALRARLGAALYLVLTVDGRVRWSPPDADDALCMALVGRHQRSDKGFGPGLGPEAVPVLQRLLAPAEGELLLGRSDWRLGGEEAAMRAELLAGYVEAAVAVEPSRGELIEGWGRRREALSREPGAELTVGHLDLLFLP